MERKRAVVIGDSHARLFKWIEERKLCDQFSFQVLSVPGATAYGSASQNSRSGFRQKAESFISDSVNPEIAFVMLGEVDSNVSAVVTARERRISPERQIGDAVERLIWFCSRIVSKSLCGAPVVFLCPTLPCVRDSSLKKGLKKRQTGIPNLESRTMLTRLFCARLEALAPDAGCSVETINDKIGDPETGFLKDEYFRSCGNHHLRHQKIYGYWLEKIEKYSEDSAA